MKWRWGNCLENFACIKRQHFASTKTRCPTALGKAMPEFGKLIAAPKPGSPFKRACGGRIFFCNFCGRAKAVGTWKTWAAKGPAKLPSLFFAFPHSLRCQFPTWRRRWCRVIGYRQLPPCAGQRGSSLITGTGLSGEGILSHTAGVRCGGAGSANLAPVCLTGFRRRKSCLGSRQQNKICPLEIQIFENPVRQFRFWRDYWRFSRMAGRRPPLGRLYPILNEAEQPAGALGACFYQAVWAMRLIASAASIG